MATAKNAAESAARPDAGTLLSRIEQRHDELLAQIELLDQQVAEALSDATSPLS